MNAYFVFIAISSMLCFWLYKIAELTLFQVIREYRRSTNSTGKKITGTILKVNKKKKRRVSGRLPTYIKVTFPNLAGSLISEEFNFIDRSPLRNRYEKGKEIRLLLDESKTFKKVILRDGSVKINTFVLGIYCAVVIGICLGIFILYSYLWTQAAGNWHKFVSQFSDATLGMLVGIYTLSLGFLYILFRSLGLAFTDKKSINYLKYHGIRTTATASGFQATGTLINNNPQVRFHFTFQDKTGRQQEGSDKKIVPLLQIGNLPQQEKIEVIYLPDFPENAQIFGKVDATQGINVVVIVFYFIFFVFSCVILGIFLGSTLF